MTGASETVTVNPSGEKSLNGFLEYVYQKNGPLAAELGDANISIEKNSAVHIFIEGKAGNSFTDLDKNKDILRQFVKEYFGIQYDVILHKNTVPDGTPAIINDDQKLNKLLDVFGGKVIKKM